MCISINILNIIREINYKYRGNYSYVRLSSDIYLDSDITRSGSDTQSLLVQYMFGYFATLVRTDRVFRLGFGYGFGYRIKCRQRR